MAEVQKATLVSNRSDHDVATELTLAFMANSGTCDVALIIKTWNEFFKSSSNANKNGI